MLLHRWHKAEAKVVLAKMNLDTRASAGRAMEFVVDVRTQDGRFFRAPVLWPLLWADFWPPTEGHVVGVEVEGETENVRFDKDDPRLSTREHDRMKQSELDAVLSQPPGSDPDGAWHAAGPQPADPHDQGGVAAAHPEWNHTRGMHNAGHQEPPKRNLP
jgi:hypothetical protein